MVRKNLEGPETAGMQRLVQDAVEVARCLGFGQQATQTHKKMALVDLRKIPVLAGGGFWGE